MLLNCGVGEDCLECLGLQDQTSQAERKSVLNIHWKDWCWSWSSNTLATWCEEMTHWTRPWRWERMKARGEGDSRGWVGWMAPDLMGVSLSNLWGLVWTGKPGMLHAVHGAIKSWTWLSGWTELNQIIKIRKILIFLKKNITFCQTSFISVRLKTVSALYFYFILIKF